MIRSELKIIIFQPSINGFEMEKLMLGWCLLNFGHELTVHFLTRNKHIEETSFVE